jgi:hypothetical protein
MKRQDAWPGGWRRYAQILRELATEPRTTQDLTAMSGCGKDGLRYAIRSMHALRLIHICRWAARPRAVPTPVWALGEGDDAPAPKVKETGKASRHCMFAADRRPKPNVIAFASIVHALSEPSTLAQVLEETGTNIGSTRVIIQVLRSLKLVRIHGWEPRKFIGGTPARRFVFAVDKNDAQRPKRLSECERSKRYYDRAQARKLAARLSFSANEPMREAA